MLLLGQYAMAWYYVFVRIGYGLHNRLWLGLHAIVIIIRSGLDNKLWLR